MLSLEKLKVPTNYEQLAPKGLEHLCFRKDVLTKMVVNTFRSAYITQSCEQYQKMLNSCRGSCITQIQNESAAVRAAAFVIFIEAGNTLSKKEKATVLNFEKISTVSQSILLWTHTLNTMGIPTTLSNRTTQLNSTPVVQTKVKTQKQIMKEGSNLTERELTLTKETKRNQPPQTFEEHISMILEEYSEPNQPRSSSNGSNAGLSLLDDLLADIYAIQTTSLENN